MSHVSHKLHNAFEGALAGGGDPATSPLYVFGPFLRLLVVGGVASITFGTTIWLAVITVAVVSAMYRLVMIWVTDGSGGSGLSEEELGSWAVKVNAAITFVEYTLTFLVSMAALVTFLADRWPMLNGGPAWFPYRTAIAIGLSVVTGWAVNRGPRMATRVFGPATLAVLLLLWTMVGATLWRRGFHLPDFNLTAFHPKYLHFTLGGYARILALMTGIEIFANLVAAYDGTPRQRSRRAFVSLLIVMGTTVVTMLIVGPAIQALSDSTLTQVSVFTQTMDSLLPAPLPYIGTLVGIAVLLSACAASAQGLQNLSLGLRYRHYIPAAFGQRNRFDVAERPVRLEIALVVLCFLFFGTHEETYLALYAAGVFILLSMTGWAASKRLTRNLRGDFSTLKLFMLAGTALAAVLTSIATVVIFEERFLEGAWTYLLFVPVLYAVFTHYRRKLGTPSSVETRLARLHAEGMYAWSHPEEALKDDLTLNRILVPLDGSILGEQSLFSARLLAHEFEARLHFLMVQDEEGDKAGSPDYLKQVCVQLHRDGLRVSWQITPGVMAEEILRQAHAQGADLIVLSRLATSGLDPLWVKSLTSRVMSLCRTPLLLIRPTDAWKSRRPGFSRLLLPLDGSATAERAIPYTRALADRFGSEILLLSVPEGSESEHFGEAIQAYLASLAAALARSGIQARIMIGTSGPSRSISAIAETEDVDLIIMASHGRGGPDRVDRIPIGSVAEQVVDESPCPVLVIPVRSDDPD
jgi:nucleotide-binding universal stress UspA family protein